MLKGKHASNYVFRAKKNFFAVFPHSWKYDKT